MLGQIFMVGMEDWVGVFVQLLVDGNCLVVFVEDENEEDVVQVYEFDGEIWQLLVMLIMVGSLFWFQSVMIMLVDGGILVVNGMDNFNFWCFKVY